MWISPEVGGKSPATAFIKVDFPAPLAPMIPRTVPSFTSKETDFSALTETIDLCPLPKLTNASLTFGVREMEVL
jgi:hypothetical protein